MARQYTLLIKGGYYDDLRRLEQVFVRNNTFIDVRPGKLDAYNEVIPMEGRVSNVLVENNRIQRGHYIAIVAKGSANMGYGEWQAEKVVIRNNTIIDQQPSKMSAGVAIYNDGGRQILVENNSIISSGMNVNIGNESYRSMAPPLSFDNYIFRGNVIENPQDDRHTYPIYFGHSYCGWLSTPDVMSATAIVHNVLYQPSMFESLIMFSNVDDIAMKNNIYMNKNNGSIYNATEHATSTAGWESNGNLLCTNGEPRFKWGTNGSCSSGYPYRSLSQFQSVTGQDRESLKACPEFANNSFVLTQTSTGYDDGIALTKTRNAGNGRDVAVEDAKYFYDGWDIEGEMGDRVMIDNTEARVVSVNYENNMLTLDRDLTWSAGAAVNYYYEGEAPSMGLLDESFYDSGSDPVPTVSAAGINWVNVLEWMRNWGDEMKAGLVS